MPLLFLLVGPRRVRGAGTVDLSKGDNKIDLNIPLQCHATLFKPKGAAHGGSILKSGKQRADAPGGAADSPAAAVEGDTFLPKEAKLQVGDFGAARCSHVCLSGLCRLRCHLFKLERYKED